MKDLVLPEAVQAVFENFLCCEFTTISKDGTPITWPLVSGYLPQRRAFFLCSPVALNQKMNHVRCNPHVSLLFSEPVGSGMVHPPRVLVQGLAEVSDQLVVGARYPDEELCEALHRSAQRLAEKQPGMKIYMQNWLTRKLMGWYFVREVVTVTPVCIRWWDDPDTTAAPQELEVSYVG